MKRLKIIISVILLIIVFTGCEAKNAENDSQDELNTISVITNI